MGRVYNALIKADGLKDHTRPIGRPDTDRATRTARHGETDERSTQVEADMEGMPVENFVAAISNSIDLDRIPPASAVAFDNNVAPREMVATTSRMRVAQVKPAPELVEPRQIASAFNLTVDPHLAAITGSDVLASERYRTLAVRVLNMAARQKLKSLLVSSADEGEGKSTVATNLAWVMAKPGERRVLLLDADLRYPSVCRGLGLEAHCGWLDLIEGSASLKDAAIRVDPNGLYVLAPGSTREPKTRAESEFHTGYTGASDALTSSRVEKLIRELERHFDFIVIDGPPIVEFADAQRLASILDGTMMVVRAGHTHHSRVTGALKLVPKDRRVGVVLNESQMDEEIAYHSRKKRGLSSLLGRKK
jgi:protein-tyrosine kinase